MILVCDQRSSRRTRVGPCVDGAYWAATSCRLSPTADSVPDVLLYFGMSHMVLSAPGRKLILDVCEAKRLQEKGSVGMMMPPTRQLQLRFFTKNKSTNHQHRVFCPPELLPCLLPGMPREIYSPFFQILDPTTLHRRNDTTGRSPISYPSAMSYESTHTPPPIFQPYSGSGAADR